MDQIAIAAGVICWTTIIVVWLGGAAYGAGWNQAGMPAPLRDRRGSIPLTLMAFAAAVLGAIVGPTLLGPFVIGAVWARLAGLAALIGSTGFALWARRELGTSWSGTPQVRGDRRLRTTGPYGVTRHPIYTGLLGMLTGSAVLAGGGPWLSLIAVGSIVLVAKVRMEERLLLAAFPDAYPRYRRDVPMLVPAVGRLSRRWRAET
jgi:protein-S-isoprenylcysteine O-methyltransferase Ste14